jgi:hypothetical protein
MVELPLHIAWTGLRILDLDRPRQHMSLYTTVLAEGMRDDLRRFLNTGIPPSCGQYTASSSARPSRTSGKKRSTSCKHDRLPAHSPG